MKFLSQPFTNEKNQVVFLSLGFFWVTNIGALTRNNDLFFILFILPIYSIILLICIYLFFKITQNKNNIDITAYSILWFLAILGTVCVLRGISLPMARHAIKVMFFEGAAVTWLMPVALLYGLKKQFWFTWLPRLRVIVGLGFIFVLTFMLLSFFARDITAHRMYNSGDFLFVSAFLFIYSIYKPNKINIFIGCMGAILLSLHMFINDERFALAYIGLMFVFYIFAVILEQHRLDLKVFIIYIGPLLLILSAFIAFQVPTFNTYIIKYFIHGKMWVNTRSGEWGGGSLAEAVTSGMSALELVFGRGIWGEYTWGTIGWPPVLYVRSTVEIGFSQIILKGGYIMLGCFLLISIYAVYLGLFRSKNRLTRYLAFIIIARLIVMITAMAPRPGFEYFMYWLVVGGCLSPQLRALDDSTIKNKCETRPIVVRW